MKILSCTNATIPEIKVIRFERVCDERGYSSEHYQFSDFENNEDMVFLKNFKILQSNENFSRKSTIRGLEFQWAPRVGKLVRVIHGHAVNLILDIRKGSPTFGKMIAHDIKTDYDNDYTEWLWVPPGFALGAYYHEDTIMEQFCTGQYNRESTNCINPLSEDIDWTACDSILRRGFDSLLQENHIMSDYDKNGLSVESWYLDSNSDNFIYLSPDDNIIVTGIDTSSLAQSLNALLPANYPTSVDFDLLDYSSMESYVTNLDNPLTQIIHCDFVSNLEEVENNNVETLNALNTNIVGTSNLVRLCMANNIKLIYLSTDSVFDGTDGTYKETDTLLPVNKYSWSKLGGECAVQLYDNSVVVRTSYENDKYTDPTSFIDQWTTRERVSQTAIKLLKILSMKELKGTIHIGASESTILYNFVDSLDHNGITECSISDSTVTIPADVSLSTDKYMELLEKYKL
jgi:dTDP-4-dehydrorhamnose 3,5-epimerase